MPNGVKDRWREGASDEWSEGTGGVRERVEV